jgi:glycosyltransferase involved in cell wall biosynthesis
MGLREFAYARFHFSKELARRMALLGHTVKLYVLSTDVRGVELLPMDGYQLKAFRPSFKFPPFLKFGNTHSLAVLKELRRDAPDIVHVQNYYLWNFPYVAPWAKDHGTPVLAQFHGTDPVKTVKAFAFYPSLRLCDRLLVPTRAEETFLTRSLHLPIERVERCPSTGVDTEIFHRMDPPDSEQLLVYAGRIPVPSNYLWEKSPQYLLPILKSLLDRGNRTRLVIAGDGPGLKSLQVAATHLRIEASVDFLGSIDQARLARMYSRSRLSFVPVHMEDIEPFWGGSLQESLACGTPVVAFNNRKPGRRRFGMLVPTEPSSAADMISKILADEDWLAQAGKEGGEYVGEHCTWNAITEHLDELYRGLKR